MTIPLYLNIKERLKMKKILLLLIILFSCGTILVDSEYDDYGYFPLHVGNKWTYINRNPPHDTLNVKITGLKKIKGYTYYRFNLLAYMVSENDIDLKEFYVRMDYNKEIVYCFDNDSRKEYVRYDFNRSEHEGYPGVNDHGWFISSRDSGISIPAGTFTDCIVFCCSGYEGYYLYEYLAYDIGLISIGLYKIKNTRVYDLRNAIINGKKIGVFD